MTSRLPDPVLLCGGGNRSDQVKLLLANSGISYLTTQDAEGSPLASLQDVLSRCSAVLAYITAARPPAGDLIEVGAGVGAGLPVLLILDPRVQVDSLPTALRELPSMRLPDPGSAEGTERLKGLLEVGARLLYPESMSRAKIAPSGLPARTKWADESEKRVAGILQDLGATVVGYEPPNRQGVPDLAILLSDMPGPPYTPILVEVGGRLADRKSKDEQLRHYMRKADALLGLLVLQDADEASWKVRSDGAVLTIGVGSLANLTGKKFAALLREGRNRLFHAR